jgi:hypothetical protein
MDAVASAEFDGFAVVEGVGIDERGSRVSLAQHLFCIGKQKAFVEVKLAGVSLGDRLIGLRDAYDSNVGAMQRSGQQAFDVSVNHPDDGDAKGRLLRGVSRSAVRD